MAKPIAVLLTLFALGAVANLPASAAEAIDVYKSPHCGCCEKWVEHLRQAGFAVQTHDVNDVPAARQRLGMPERLGSCQVSSICANVTFPRQARSNSRMTKIGKSTKQAAMTKPERVFFAASAIFRKGVSMRVSV